MSNSVKEVKIVIAGVGGGGGNAIDYMIKNSIKDVTFIAFNTDVQDLNRSNATKTIMLGTEGFGAGSKPEVAKAAAEESEKEIRKALEDADLVFITAGMGGGTGTGASPVIARIAKELNKLTVAVVTKPFRFEGSKQMKKAVKGILELEKIVDSLIVIENQRIFKLTDKENIPIADAYEISNDILKIAINTIVGIIQNQTMVNVDFNDVKNILENSGLAVFGYGEAKEGEDPLLAVHRATSTPLLEQSMQGAKSILVLFKVNNSISINEYERITDEVVNIICGEITDDNDYELIHGLEIDNNIKGIQISLVVSNFDGKKVEIEPEYETIKTKNTENKIFNISLPVYDN